MYGENLNGRSSWDFFGHLKLQLNLALQTQLNAEETAAHTAQVFWKKVFETFNKIFGGNGLNGGPTRPVTKRRGRQSQIISLTDTTSYSN